MTAASSLSASFTLRPTLAIVGRREQAGDVRTLIGDGFDMFAYPFGLDGAAVRVLDKAADAVVFAANVEGLGEEFPVLRAAIALPLIVVTARDDSEQRARALELGADEALCAEFGASEIRARIVAAIRRSRTRATRVLRIDDLEIDADAIAVRRCGVPVHLSPGEFGLLFALARRNGMVATRDDLERELWGAVQPKTDGKLNTMMSTLRAKIDVVSQRRLIRTIHRIGYALRA